MFRLGHERAAAGSRMFEAIAGDPNEPMARPSAYAKADAPGVQKLQERNDAGELMIDQVDGIVERATRRCYSECRDVYFRVTVTDWFGGRGHDFDCMDEKARYAPQQDMVATVVVAHILAARNELKVRVNREAKACGRHRQIREHQLALLRAKGRPIVAHRKCQRYDRRCRSRRGR